MYSKITNPINIPKKEFDDIEYLKSLISKDTTKGLEAINVKKLSSKINWVKNNINLIMDLISLVLV